MMADAWGWMALGWAGSALAVFSLMQTRIVRLRALNLAARLIVMVYHVPLGVWPTVVLNAVVAAINAVHLRRLRRAGGPSPVAAMATRATAGGVRVVETTASDALARALLESHRAEVEARIGATLESLLLREAPVAVALEGDRVVSCSVLGRGTSTVVFGDPRAGG